MNALLALLLLVQDTPEQAFQKIEAAIENARTLKVEFTIDASADDASPGKGFFTIEEGGRVKMSAELKSKTNPTVVMSMDCNGTKIESTIDRHRVEAPYDPKMGRSNFNMYLARMGVFPGAIFQHFFWSGAARAGGQVTIDLKQMFQVENIRFGGDGKNGTKILTYDFKVAFEPKTLEKAKIWYDPKTYKIVRRECRMMNRQEAEVIYEEYTEVQYGDGKSVVGGKEKPPPPPPIPDADLDNIFFKAKLQVAESHLRAGKKDKAAEILEEIIKTYPKHAQVADARRLLEEARKK